MFFPSMVALLVGWAAAAEGETSLGVRLSGESLQDPYLSAAYTAEGLGGELTASVPLPKNLSWRVSVGYHRRGGFKQSPEGDATTLTSWLMYIPVSAPVYYDIHAGSAAVGVGLGPAYVVFAEPTEVFEEGEEYYGRKQSGGKFALVAELEARLATNMVSPSLHAPDEGARRLDVVVTAGYRLAARHLNPANQEGLSFSAVRVGLGLELVY